MPSDTPAWLDRTATAQLPLLVLALLAGGSQHGYGISQQLEQVLGKPCAYGTLYPLLKKMREQEWIEDVAVDKAATKAPGRATRLYKLTPLGREALRKQTIQWQSQQARIQGVVLPMLRRLMRDV